MGEVLELGPPQSEGNRGAINNLPQTTFEGGEDPYENIKITSISHHRARTAGGLALSLEMAEYGYEPESMPRN